MDTINKTLVENYVRDLQKKELDKFERAAIIRQYIEDKHISQREFARRFGIPKSTVEDWLLYNNIHELDYSSMKKKGFNATEIYRLLRENKRKELLLQSALNKKLILMIDTLNRSTTVKGYTEETPDLINKLEKSINTFKYRLEHKKGIRLQ